MNPEDQFRGTPPRDAHSRTNDPERFRPLHRVALDLLDHYHAHWDVSRTATFDPVPGMAPFQHARPPVTLTPATPGAAPIAIAFTPFPSLIARFGRWIAEPFPSCGCDECGETAEAEAARLEALVRHVVAGRFQEELLIPWFGDGRLSWTFGERGGPGDVQTGWSRVPRKRALALASRDRHPIQWQRWPARHGT